MVRYVIQVRYPSGLIVAFRVQVDADTLHPVLSRQGEEFEEVATGLGGTLYSYEKEN